MTTKFAAKPILMAAHNLDASRLHEQQKPSGEVRLRQTMADGSSEGTGAPQERIYSILPRGRD